MKNIINNYYNNISNNIDEFILKDYELILKYNKNDDNIYKIYWIFM
jgi:hypothetical protein